MAGTERGSVPGYAVDAGFPLSHKPDVFAWLITFDAQANARAGCLPCGHPVAVSSARLPDWLSAWSSANVRRIVRPMPQSRTRLDGVIGPKGSWAAVVSRRVSDVA